MVPTSMLTFALAATLAGATYALTVPHEVSVLGARTTASLRADAAHATNGARAGHCKALKLSARLSKAAQGHADDMAAQGYFSHSSADGRSWDDRVRAAGYPKPGGENIAAGYTDGFDVVAGWLDSPGHKRNIMDCAFTRVGYGYNATGGYWVQDFGR